MELRKSRKAGVGLESSPKSKVESVPGDSPAKISNIREEESVVTCGLIWDLVTASTAQQDPDNVPEIPVTSMSLSIPNWKELVL